MAGLVGGGGGVGGLTAEVPGEYEPCGAQIHVRDVRPGQPRITQESNFLADTYIT